MQREQHIVELKKLIGQSEQSVSKNKTTAAELENRRAASAHKHRNQDSVAPTNTRVPQQSAGL